MHRCRNHSCLCTVNSCSTPTSRQVDFPSFFSLHWLEAPYVLPRETQTGSNKHCYNRKAYSWWHLAVLAKVLSVSLPFFSCCRSSRVEQCNFVKSCARLKEKLQCVSCCCFQNASSSINKNIERQSSSKQELKNTYKDVHAIQVVKDKTDIPACSAVAQAHCVNYSSTLQLSKK